MGMRLVVPVLTSLIKMAFFDTNFSSSRIIAALADWPLFSLKICFSSKLFQDSHCGHLPSHFGELNPQELQVKMVFDLLKNNLFYENKVIICILIRSQRTNNQGSKGSFLDSPRANKKKDYFFLLEV